MFDNLSKLIKCDIESYSGIIHNKENLRAPERRSNVEAFDRPRL